MNAIEFLRKEHDHLRQSLLNISRETHREETKLKMFNCLSQELIRHEKMEHEVWYPHFRSKISHTVKHLLTEEKHAENAIKQLNEVKKTDEWEEKFSKFRKDVELHAKDEEINLFPEVKKLLSADDLEQIGLKMYQYKKDHPIS
jgi:hypothetical protein